MRSFITKVLVNIKSRRVAKAATLLYLFRPSQRSALTQPRLGVRVQSLEPSDLLRRGKGTITVNESEAHVDFRFPGSGGVRGLAGFRESAAGHWAGDDFDSNHRGYADDLGAPDLRPAQFPCGC